MIDRVHEIGHQLTTLALTQGGLPAVNCPSSLTSLDVQYPGSGSFRAELRDALAPCLLRHAGTLQRLTIKHTAVLEWPRAIVATLPALRSLTLNIRLCKMEHSFSR